MTPRTRYFVIASLLVLTVGLGTGVVAYYFGFQASASQGPDELGLLPADSLLVGYADVRAVMASEVRQKLLQMVPSRGQGQQQFQDQTGINIETDIDRVIACLAPQHVDGQSAPLSGMVIARGRFNETKIEALMREHGAHIEDYKGKRLVVADVPTPQGQNTFALGFLEPGLVAVGSTAIVQTAVDLSQGSGQNVTANLELMDFVKTLDGNAWAVGKFDALSEHARLPAGIATQIPPITWFAASARVDGGISGTLRADARDEESANSLRDVVRGIVAFVKLQSGARPELRPMVDSIQLGGAGKSVTLSFDISPQMLDLVASTVQGLGRSRAPR